MKSSKVNPQKHRFGKLVAALFVGTVKSGRVAAPLHPVHSTVFEVFKVAPALASHS